MGPPAIQTEQNPLLCKIDSNLYNKRADLAKHLGIPDKKLKFLKMLESFVPYFNRRCTTCSMSSGSHGASHYLIERRYPMFCRGCHSSQIDLLRDGVGWVAGRPLDIGLTGHAAWKRENV